MAGITNNVPDGTVMLGVPATPEREQKLKLAAVAKLPEMRKEFKAMRRAIAGAGKSGRHSIQPAARFGSGVTEALEPSMQIAARTDI